MYFCNPLPPAQERAAVALAVDLLPAGPNVLELLAHRPNAIKNRAGWLLCCWFHMQEGGQA